MTFSKSLNELLTSSNLDLEKLESLIRIAIAEDLDGAVDVTSVATIPEEQSAVAEFWSRKP
jgi:nicotinate-nucleotide pyrophosphorylase (carboxylating)